MEELDYRIEEAGARLLGHDIAAILKKQTKEFILRILEEETDESGESRLLTTMVKGSLIFDEDFVKYKTFLLEIKKGLYE